MANLAKRLIMSRLTAASRCYSTVTALNKGKEESLFRWLSSFGGSSAGVADAANQWVKQGNSVNRLDVISCVTQLRKFRKYQHAIQLYEWMEKGNNKMNNADRAIHIDLLGKAEGVALAEKYFNSLEESAKTTKTYGALLSCYCKEKMFEKAVQLFEEMKELSFTSPLNYNNMMSLYLSIGQPEKVPLLAKEMEELNIAADRYNYNQLMNAYAALKDYDALEGVLESMKTKKVMPGWFTYGNLATIYVNAGLTDKAHAVLRKLNKKKNVPDCEAYHSLITLYGRISYLPGVYRAWKSLKLNFPKPTNTSYLIMLLALLKLDDVNGLEKYFTKWVSSCSTYDVRLANVMLESYLNRNMIKEANDLHENVVSRGVEPNLKTMDLFTNFYLKKRQMDLALKFFEMGASKVGSEKGIWFPSDETVSMFLKFFDEEKDEDSVEKFCKIMRKIGRLDSNGDISRLRTCIAAGKVEDESAK
ncbi:hypothetical protein Acr_00g0013450 [Actinidia rufa]|uniref:Tetratricopeptide repeat (TPR)-like superfamily protein n=1 Tax=Actinidia rufa TaxID=165716 RepID=A0A7J0DBR7_9ERIC|nr:hypothetical protein Acr_00g0013450 [Actinidia rufa]